MIYWFTGQPGAGKTTLAVALIKELKFQGRPAVHLDGDILRAVTDNHDFSTAGRMKNVRAAQALAAKVHSEDVWVVAAFVSPFRQLREEFKKRGDVVEVYVHTTTPRGRESYFVKDYEPPLENFIDVDTTNAGVEECIRKVLAR
ncbi:MAG TPA: adenylyl-sulfate kinase [Desulfuromonadaceae bacterium]|nr:adenylyl-sulfate kinase [Desulfuromonadaceae bacterium]